MWLFYFLASFVFGIWLLKSSVIEGGGVGSWVIVIIGALVGAFISANILSRKKGA